MEAEAMNATEAARLADWMKDHGHTDAEIIECIKFLATGITPTKPN